MEFILGLRPQLEISPTLRPNGHRHRCFGLKILNSVDTKLLPHKACFPIRRPPFPDLLSLNAAEMGTFEEQSRVCETRPPSPLRIPAWIPRHRRNIFLLLVTMTHKSDSGDKLRTIQQKKVSSTEIKQVIFNTTDIHTKMCTTRA